jgi:hypothetical protein
VCVGPTSKRADASCPSLPARSSRRRGRMPGRAKRGETQPSPLHLASWEGRVGLANYRARDRRPWQVLGDDVQPPTNSFRVLRAAGGAGVLAVPLPSSPQKTLPLRHRQAAPPHRRTPCPLITLTTYFVHKGYIPETLTNSTAACPVKVFLSLPDKSSHRKSSQPGHWVSSVRI